MNLKGYLPSKESATGRSAAPTDEAVCSREDTTVVRSLKRLDSRLRNDYSFRMTKRDSILEAALALFEERTYGSTPMPLVAERAGVGAGTIYRYFPSKEALANAIYRKGKEQMRRYLVDAVPGGLEPRDEFSCWWQQLFQFSTDHPAALAFLETHHHAPYLDEESKVAGAPIDLAAADLVTRGQAAGAVRQGPPAELIAMVFGAFVGLVRAARDGHVTLDDALRKRTEDAIWGLLAP